MKEKKQRIIFYIDGFNFYFGLKSKNWHKYYWLDLVKFCEQFIKAHQVLIEVNYFSAIPFDKAKQDRQDLFFSANKLNNKFNLLLGKFLKKELLFNNKTYTTYEEKQTDVHIAVKMISDVVYDKCDISILISADSDLIPPIDFLHEFKPNHKIFVFFPPKRNSFDLKSKSDYHIYLENHKEKFEKSLLDNSLTLPNGFIITRPEKWK